MIGGSLVLAVLQRELGWRSMLAITCLTVLVALAAALLARGLGMLVLS